MLTSSPAQFNHKMKKPELKWSFNAVSFWVISELIPEASIESRTRAQRNIWLGEGHKLWLFVILRNNTGFSISEEVQLNFHLSIMVHQCRVQRWNCWREKNENKRWTLIILLSLHCRTCKNRIWWELSFSIGNATFVNFGTGMAYKYMCVLCMTTVVIISKVKEQGGQDKTRFKPKFIKLMNVINLLENSLHVLANFTPIWWRYTGIRNPFGLFSDLQFIYWRTKGIELKHPEIFRRTIIIIINEQHYDQV